MSCIYKLISQLIRPYLAHVINNLDPYLELFQPVCSIIQAIFTSVEFFDLTGLWFEYKYWDKDLLILDIVYVSLIIFGIFYVIKKEIGLSSIYFLLIILFLGDIFEIVCALYPFTSLPYASLELKETMLWNEELMIPIISHRAIPLLFFWFSMSFLVYKNMSAGE